MSSPAKIPQHVAIIMDGNGRWARKRGLPKIAGHRQGVKAAEEAMEAAKELGVKYLTLYTFSTENWKRPKTEVEGLFRLLEDYIDREGDKLNKNKIRFNIIGDIDALPATTKDKLRKTIEATKSNADFTLNLAVNYGSRDEMLRAVRSIAEDVKRGTMSAESVTEAAFSERLYTAGMPDPDLLIRTSGEFRLSNFLLWQLSYAEIYISSKLWPDFHRADFVKAIEEFASRDRRYGG